MKKSIILVFVAVLGLVITLLGCVSAPERRGYVVPETSVEADWEHIRHGANQVI